MLFAILILTSISGDIQARLTNETEPLLHDVYKRSPAMLNEPCRSTHSKIKFHNAFAPAKQRESSNLQVGAFLTGSNKPSLCAGSSLQQCLEEHPQAVKQCKVCGIINSPGLRHSIVSGKPVDPPYKYPWMVVLIRDNQKQCGAALINDRYVLTAAHCLAIKQEDLPRGFTNFGRDVFYRPNEISVAFVTETKSVENGPPIEKIIPHPQYRRKTKRYDIALLKLEKKITCGKYRNPICLPSPDFNIYGNAVLYVTGWGVTVGEMPYEFPDQLMEGTARRVDFARCNAKMSFKLEDISYCLVGRERSRPCFGDSGGSMFYYYKKKVYSMGIASLHTCDECGEGEPFVYLSVPKLVQWIEKIAGPRIKP